MSIASGDDDSGAAKKIDTTLGFWVTVIVGFSLSLGYFILQIVALCIDRDVCKEGEQDTPLWIFCVVSIFGPLVAYSCTYCFPVKSQTKLAFDQKLSTKSNRHEDQQNMQDENNFNIIAQEVLLSSYAALYFVVATLFIAGEVEVCDDLKSEPIWIWFMITYVLCCVFLLYRLVMLIRTLIAICFCKYYDNERQEYMPEQTLLSGERTKTEGEEKNYGTGNAGDDTVFIRGGVSFVTPDRGDSEDTANVAQIPEKPSKRRTSLFGGEYQSVHSAEV